MAYTALIFWNNNNLSCIGKIAFLQEEEIMIEDNKSEGKVTGDLGIVAGGNVTFGDNSGQLAVGENITQYQIQSINQPDLKELRENLLEFQKGINKLELDPDYQNSVNGNISTAVIEIKKKTPSYQKLNNVLKKPLR
ncbi:MAG: hypothetical protein NHB15_11530 [Methanosarcina barkeri]|nr:hypothetical protein [Methanosarcina sp. ERenArc_MAG2]